MTENTVYIMLSIYIFMYIGANVTNKNVDSYWNLN